MILLYTDFGADGPYLGQVEGVIHRLAPQTDVINLLSNAPRDPLLASYLLAALAPQFPENSVFFCVIDPGVGGDRLAVALEADGRWFVAPDNGLLNTVAVQARIKHWRIIDWQPERLSASFHGRDLFAPIAARIARNDFAWPQRNWQGPDLNLWPPDLAAIVHCDHYGNAISGLRYTPSLDGKQLKINDHSITQAHTFSSKPAGETFWYCNSMGLVEIAVNRGHAAKALNLEPGMPVIVTDPAPFST